MTKKYLKNYLTHYTQPVFFGNRSNCFWNNWKKFSNFNQNVQKYRLMNTVTASFTTTVRQMTDMF